MKKEYISPFAKIIESTIAERILAGSNNETQGIGNGPGGTLSDQDGGLGSDEGDDVITLSKYRGFYE